MFSNTVLVLGLADINQGSKCLRVKSPAAAVNLERTLQGIDPRCEDNNTSTNVFDMESAVSDKPIVPTKRQLHFPFISWMAYR